MVEMNYAAIGDRIRQKRKEIGLTQKELAAKVSLSEGSVSKYENGKVEDATNTKLNEFAQALGVDIGWLLGIPLRSKNKVPVLGRVRAGIPIEAIEEILDYEEIPQDMASNGDYFALRITGNSMEPRICDGDIVIVKRQSDVESGDIAIVLVNGSDATCKKLVKHENGISLIAFNSAYEPRFFTNEEIISMPITIVGRVVELRGKF
jgi:repressor LexA